MKIARRSRTLYTTLINGHVVAFALQAAREVEVKNRLKQSTGLFSATYKF